MTTLKKIFSSVTIIGVLMTTPNVPVENSGGLALAEAIQGVPVSSVVARVGKVTAITESDNITVAISGSNVLVSASYLFPQYQPVLGDYVIVLKQDAQWLVLGTASGPVDSNTLALNPGFELGTIGALPTSWTLTNTSVAAGVPTFVKTTTFNPLSGLNVGQLEVTNNGVLSFSTSEVISARVPVNPGEVWTGAGFIRVATLAGPNRIRVTSYLRFFDGTGTLISDELLNGGQQISASGAGWQLLRPDSTLSATVAPATAASVSLVVEVLFNFQDANEQVIVEFDNMILRQVA